MSTITTVILYVHDDSEREEQRRRSHQRRQTGSEYRPNTRHVPSGGSQSRPGRSAKRIWAGTVSIQPNAKTGVHHHGELESVIYVVRGRARMRWGDHLEYVAEAGPGDFFSFRRSFRIRRSMQAQTNPSNAYSCARTKRPSWSILPISTPSNSQKRFTGPILFTSTPEEGPASNFWQWNAGRPVVLESAPCRRVAGARGGGGRMSSRRWSSAPRSYLSGVPLFIRPPSRALQG